MSNTYSATKTIRDMKTDNGSFQKIKINQVF